MAATHTLSHPTLNSKLTGLVNEDANVVQYRGIKFANISARFARSTAVESYPAELDCTKDGPVSPQVPQPEFVALLFAVPPEQLIEPVVTVDEFECLNLIVTVPKGVKEGELLPVFVHIHGGANRQGASSIPLLDMTNLCSRSIAKSQPVVMVSINYRLSIFGFGTLSDGAKANNGLFDQRLGLQWIQQHIAGFGGDPKRVTVSGQSAGSFGLDCHLQAKGSDNDPKLQLFRRAVLMSGTVGSNRPRSLATVIKMTQMYGDALDGEGDAEAKLKRASVSELIELVKIKGQGVWPYVEDGDFFEKPFKLYESVPEWCEGILIGDTANEAFVFGRHVLSSSAPSLIAAFKSLGPAGEKLIEAYNISGDNVHLGTFAFLSDGIFMFPVHRTIETWNSKAGKHAHQYLMDQRNPWSPETHGAHHAVDLIFLWGKYKMPNTEADKVATAVQNDFLNFVTAEEREIDRKLGWDSAHLKAYGGPDGFVGVLSREQLRERRRTDIMDGLLKELGDEFVGKAANTILRYPNGAVDTTRLDGLLCGDTEFMAAE